jgi:hypothetical protein
MMIFFGSCALHFATSLSFPASVLLILDVSSRTKHEEVLRDYVAAGGYAPDERSSLTEGVLSLYTLAPPLRSAKK